MKIIKNIRLKCNKEIQIKTNKQNILIQELDDTVSINM